MLTLHLIRHAEAESVYNSGSDFSRKLTPNGISQAQQLGRTLANLSINLGEVACSGATRTRQTAQQLIEQMGQINICYVDELYASSHIELLQYLSEQKNQHQTIIGHNDAISSLASYLCGEYIHLDTANYVRLSFPFSDWKLISIETATKEQLITR